MAAPSKHKESEGPASRDRILVAASAEFAARGYAGCGVDRIAHRARVNKAMIYYHFKNKQTLYRAILRDIFSAIGGRVRVIATSHCSPEQKLDAFIETLVRGGEANPHFAPMMLRELAEGGAHLDPEILRLMAGLLESVRAIVVEGERDGAFRPAHPALTHFTIVGPIMFFLGSAQVRTAVADLRIADLTGTDSAAFIGHLQEMTRRGLASRSAGLYEERTPKS
jgi:AcrR family transcriptional regulator